MTKEIEVKMTVQLPVLANDTEIQDWLDFSLIGGSISRDNPLSCFDVEAKPFSIIFQDY